MTIRKIVLTAIRRDGSSKFLSSRTLAAGERPNLYLEATAAMDQSQNDDDENERRVCRNEIPRTTSVRADLRENGELVERDEVTSVRW